MRQQPKHITKNFRSRNHAIGTERRLNMTKEVMENQIHFPKTVGYEDIDQAVYEWLRDDVEIVHNGKRLPTFKLFSVQRMSEYGQTWKKLDDKGNIELNFKTITRESNPQKGDNQGGIFNIPGRPDFPIYRVPSKDDNGMDVINVYSVKQPVSVNLIYKFSVFTDYYKVLNDMNSKMQSLFSGLQVYIAPNGFYMPMTLTSVGDESEYVIDDRKYYGQSFTVKMSAFIISEEDYKVTSVPIGARVKIGAATPTVKPEKFNIGIMEDPEHDVIVTGDTCKDDTKLEIIDKEPVTHRPPEIDMEEHLGLQACWRDTEDEKYVNRKVIITISYSHCDMECEFEVDSNLELETVSLKNVESYVIKINGEAVDVENSDVLMNDGDVIRVECTLKNPLGVGEIRLICFDRDEIVKKGAEPIETRI